MSEVFEVIFTSADGDKTSTANVWNIQTGTNLMTYKDGGMCALKGLCLLGSDYVIAAEKNKPMLKIWAINSQLPLNSPRLLCPGIVTTIAVNPDKCHIAVAVQEKLHIYSVSSGQLLGTGARHFQPIRVLKWSSDGNFIACGGEDCLVTVWLLSSLVTKSVESEPLYVFSDHSLAVSDVYITPEGLKAHLISVSSDRTCKIYNICDGSLLLSLVFDNMLTAVCTNTLESDVFVGTNTGGILQFSLHNAPRTKEYHLNTEEKAPVFVGHTKSITCLSSSLEGDLLLSGSADGTAKIWHVSSNQCLRTITHKGQVTNVFFTIAPKQMFNHDLKLSVSEISSFSKSGSEEKSPVISVFTNSDLKLCTETTDNHVEIDYFENNCDTENADYTDSLKKEVEKLKAVNKQLYNFAVNSILQKDKRNNNYEDSSYNSITETDKHNGQSESFSDNNILEPDNDDEGSENNLEDSEKPESDTICQQYFEVGRSSEESKQKSLKSRKQFKKKLKKVDSQLKQRTSKRSKKTAKILSL